ncbi:MAG TPA: site-2 protease family protein [candidate division Zixibacteria bacterium]|nr:site-2 protease family protein [candidate division Zixibacteria bacterium]
MFNADFLRQALVAAPVILFSLTVHEFFHAYTAYRYGDSTAKDMGRLTLNPLAHLDFFGTIMMFLSGFRFGWAKPVPVNPYNLRNPRVADFWISAAGPLSNIGLAFLFGMVFRVIAAGGMAVPEAVLMIIKFGVSINISLAFFNLIPLYPLDGSHILKNILPAKYEAKLFEFQRFSPYILLFLIVTRSFWFILGPIIIWFIRLFAGNAFFYGF